MRGLAGKNTRFVIILLLAVMRLGPAVFAQNITVSSPSPTQFSAVSMRAFTLDETLNALGASGLRAEFQWDPFLRSGTFSAGEHYGAFTAAAAAGETGFFVFDNREIFNAPLPYLDRGELIFPESFVQTIKDTFSRSFEEENSRFRIAAIIIDPGHGGKDSGAVGNHSVNGKSLKAVEKDIVLNASKQLNALLSRAYPDKQVLMTRDRDVFYSLEQRVAIANSVPLRDNEAIIYISIHANASLNKQVRGYEVWYLSPDYRRNVLDHSKYTDSTEVIPILNDMMEEEFTTESIIIAQSILNSFQSTMGKSMPSRGLKAEKWFVVRNSRMPAVLVELGFVSNSEDALLMTTDTHLQKLTNALYKGITDFVSVFEHSGGFTAAQ